MIKLKKDNFKFTGFYRGKVVDNNDPDKAGRIRVKVYPMFADLPEEEYDAIPWAVPAFPISRGSGDFGTFAVPKIGSFVWVFFENFDYNQPVYFAEAFSKANIMAEFNTSEYPDKLGFKLSNGIYVYFVDRNSNKILGVSHPSGTYIKIFDNGAVIIHSANNVVIEGTTVSINP